MKSDKNNEGFTFVESMIAMFLLSIINIAAFALCRNYFRVINKAELLFKDNIKIIEIDSLMRREIQKIKYPWWSKEDLWLSDCKGIYDLESKFQELDIKEIKFSSYQASDSLIILWKYKNVDYESICPKSVYKWGQYEI